MAVTTKKLTVQEFLELDLESELNRIELHDGEVVEVPGPKPKHTKLQTLLSGVLLQYQLNRPEFMPLVEPSLALGEREFRRPDLIVILEPELGGRCLAEESAFSGPPEVIVEVLSSKPWHDLVRKRRLYAAAEIPEYWVLNPQEPEALFLRLEEGVYQEAAVLREGIYETPRLPGFRLDVGALFEGDFQALVTALRPGG